MLSALIVMMAVTLLAGTAGRSNGSPKRFGHFW